MSPDPDTQRAPLAVDELARVVLELAAEPELAALIARFTERIRAWAAPSALVAAARGSEPGSWRVLPALSFGSLPLGIERALQQLVEDVPECLAQPAVQQPLEPVAGVKLRDNWIVPWWCEGESGLLLLRGVPRPCPPNLGEALALVSAPVWPRLLGGPAARVESLVAQLQQLSGRLQLETGRELERLQTAAAAAAAAAREAEAPLPPAADPAEVRLQETAARLDQELRAATEELRTATEQLRAAGDETTQLRGRAAQLEEQAGLLQQQAVRQGEENAALVQRLHGLEEQRGTVRVADARARVAEEALAAAQAAIASHAGVLRDEREATVARIEEHRRALESAEQRALEGEQALAAARKDLEAHSERLDAERAAVEREEQQRRASDAAAAALRQQSESLQAALEAAQAELEPAQAELAAARADLAAAQGRAAAEQERARLADETLAVVRTALVSLHRSAFVPSGLRFALEDVSAAVGPGAPRRIEGMRLVILDRDLGGLESLASELEAGGLDVRIANYPEELALLLRTPGGRDVVAAICDVMAFRPDQNIAGLFRSWEKDRPGLAFFLSYDADSSVELERARRVPLSLTLAHLPRPLPAKRVGEAIELLARRQGRQ